MLADAVQVSVDGTNYVNATLAADGSFAYTTPILSAGSQTITVKAVKGTTVVTKTAAVTVPTAAQASVISADAVNPREVKVVFNQEVEKASAEDYANNYKVTYNAGTTTIVTGAKLLDDNKTVILTVDSDGAGASDIMADGKSYKVDKVENVLTKSNNQKMVKYEGTSKLFSNTEGPKLLKVEKTVDNKFKLTFDKHTTNTVAVKIDNVTLTLATDGVTPAEPTVTAPVTDPGIYTLTTRAIDSTVPAEQALVASGIHTAVVTSAADVASVTNPVQQMSFNITGDTTAPSVASVTPFGYNAFKVKFSEPIYTSAGVEAANLDALVTAGNLEVKKGTFVYPKTVASGVADGYVSTTKVANEDYTYLVTMNDKVVVGTPTVNYDLYDSGASSTQLSLTLKGYKDAVGLIGNVYTSTVTLSKETVKPYVKSTNLNKYTAGSPDTMTIKFSEDLSTLATNLDGSKVAVYDQNNVKQDVIKTGVSVTGDTLSIAFNVDPTTPTQLFKVVIDAGAVKDLSGNANDAITTYVDNRAAAQELTMAGVAGGHDTASNMSAVGAAGKIASIDNAKNTIMVNYGAHKMSDSAILAANYKLDGAALPVGAKVDFITNDATTGSVVKITLPDGIYSSSSAGTLTLSKSIISDDGAYYASNGSDKEATAAVVLSDNVKPVLTGAKFVASSTDTTTKAIELTFSEGLGAITTASNTDNIDDFVVVIGGAEYKVAKIGSGIGVDGSTGIGNVTAGSTKVRIALSDAININQSATIKVVPVGDDNAAIDTVDTAKDADGSTADGNKLTAGTTVTITGTVTP